jgi:glycerol-3-phosphate dehydrogenase
MAAELGWDAARTAREIANYLKRVDAERASQEQPDDASADRVRLEAPDIVTAPER